MTVQRKEYYTPKEVASIAGVTVLTVYSHISKGQLKAKKIGKLWRISHESLISYLGP